VYLNVLQLVEHLKVYLLDEVPRQINRANSCHGSESASTDIRDVIVTEI
jgi:hypothetical protein